MGLKKGTLLFTALLGILAVFAQNTVIDGKVTDKATHEALDYANVKFKGTFAGVKTDSAGYYRITSTQKVKSIVVSYLGYQSVEVLVQQGVANHLDVQLVLQSVELRELVVKPPKKKKREIDTTALYIYHHVVKNKDFNKATTFDSYHFNEYTKMVYSVENPTEKFLKTKIFKPYKFFFEKIDTTAEGRAFIPLFVQEDYKETYYRKDPKKKISIVHYRRLSGIKGSAIVKFVGYHFEVTDAYENVHVIFLKSFVSPFSPEGRGLYNYHVIDTALINGRTTYRLNFVGKNKEDLCFKGFADIDSATWAIKFISYKPNPKANFNYIYDLQEEQTFDMIENHWMMVKENLTLEGNLLKNPEKLAVRLVKTTLRKDIKTNISIPDSIDKNKDDIVDKNAYRKNTSYIDSMRFDTLTRSERLVYHHFDTIRHLPAYKSLKFVTALLTTANIRVGPLDFGELYRVVSLNDVEGYRLRMGVRTNGELDEKLYLAAFGAYGTKDKAWKYAFNARYLLPSKYDRWHAIELEYKNDMIALGNENTVLPYDNIFSLLNPDDRLREIMRVRQLNLYYERDWIKGLSSNINLSDRTYFTTPGVFNFTKSDGHGNFVYMPSFNVNEFSVSLRYCKSDRYYESYTYRYVQPTKTPSITFQYTQGIKNTLLNGDYNYYKFSLQFVHRLQLPAIGYSKIIARTGYILGNSPYPVSFLTSSNPSVLRDDLTFQSTAPFEFVTNRYVMLWWEHYFDGFFFNRIPYVNLLHLREYIQVKAVYGDYSAKNASLIPLPAGVGVPSPVPYVEVGCGVENILNIIHVDFLWRVTYRNNPNAANFTVKFAIYPGF